MPSTYYCRPSDILTPSATLSLTAGAANAAFPLTNAQDRKAHTVFKSTGTGCTIRSHWSSAKTIQALALINHKLAGATVTVTNPAGFNQAFAIPANSEDGHGIDPWMSFLGLANTSDDDWDIAITGAATVCAIGEILWVETLRTLPIEFRAQAPEAHLTIVRPTDYGVRNKCSLGVRQRGLRGRVSRESAAADLLALQRDAAGAFREFLLVPFSSTNDALYVDLVTDARTPIIEGPNFRPVDLEFIEAQKGLAL